MATSMPQILFVLSSCDKLNDGTPTGWWLSEFSHPFSELHDTFRITVCSPSGGLAPIDPASIEAVKDDQISINFHKSQSSLWENTNKLSSFLGKADDFAAIFYVGGHGPMYDLAQSDDSAKLIQEFAARGKVVAAVCHGPGALTHPRLKEYLRGEGVTGFSNSEEKALGKMEKVPFSLEDRLQEFSGRYSKGDDWSDYCVSSKGGKLLTGQNPASAASLGKKVKQAVFGSQDVGRKGAPVP